VLFSAVLIWHGVKGGNEDNAAVKAQPGVDDSAAASGEAAVVLSDNPPGFETAGEDTGWIVEQFELEKALLILDSLSLFVAPGERQKYYLLQMLEEKGWTGEDIAVIKVYFEDSRTEFIPRILKINSTHQETEELYAQQLTQQSVDRCLRFWREEGDRVSRAAKPYGIPPEIIIAIMKIETNFGIYKGQNPIFNVFWTLSVADHPAILRHAVTDTGEAALEQRKRLLRRANWGRSQLFELVQLYREGAGDGIFWVKGSWAGAFGLPQFIPTSYRTYRRDGNNDGKIDLDSTEDAVASIAYYLQENGWKGNMNRSRMKKVIMRYNYSTYYADAVIALADKIRRQIARERE
jgi:membrane-bound lytic murein transglycosylase B